MNDLEAKEICFYRTIQRISWSENVSNLDVLKEIEAKISNKKATVEISWTCNEERVFGEYGTHKRYWKQEHEKKLKFKENGSQNDTYT